MSLPMKKLPTLALSVRQPWAWAILFGGKIIENRTRGAIRSGAMVTGPVALHAASGMKEAEYRWGADRLARHGVTCPRPDDLIRGAIIGQVTVTDIVDRSDSEWFGGPCGLVLADPLPCTPIPARGALGYFAWEPAETLSPIAPWMRSFDRPNGDAATLELFADAAPTYATRPTKPWRPKT